MEMESEKCNLCPNRCDINRKVKEGLCHADFNMRVCRIAPHFGEEPIISGKNGSGTVFFSGCGMDCEFCQNYLISKSKTGKVFTPEQLAVEFRYLENLGVHNINLVTPTHFSIQIAQTLDLYHPNIPIIYNTSGYELPSIIKKMNRYIDIYLVDLKYGDEQTAYKYSKRKNYVKYAIESIEVMCREKPLLYDNNGMLKQGVIVRHLILPENINNTLKVIDIYAEKFKDKSLFSLMSQFVPCYKSTIRQKITPLEYKIALRHMEKADIANGFVQELSSASTDFIPEFFTDD